MPAGSIGVDLSREERLERYRSVAKAFANVRPALDAIIEGYTTQRPPQKNNAGGEIESLTRQVLEMHDRHIVSSMSAQ